MRTAILIVTVAGAMSHASAQMTSTPYSNQPQIQPRGGAPLPDLSPDELERYWEGKRFYEKPITKEEGLGPIFNRASCASCHHAPLGGPGLPIVTHFGHEENGTFDALRGLGGHTLQVNSLDLGSDTFSECRERIPKEANVAYNRVTPGALGYGLIEAIRDQDLVNLESNPPSSNVSGRVHWVKVLEDPGAPDRPGRYGWQAVSPTVMSFTAGAAFNEMSFSNRVVPFDTAPNGDQDALARCDSVPDPEDGPHLGDGMDLIDRWEDFQRFMAAPPQTPKSGMAGETLFASIGCADCHVPSFRTSADPNLEFALRDREIRPYSDFLLHNMGELADFPDRDAAADEFRTTPLWGLSTRPTFLHDGRVGQEGTFEERVTEAILWHDTEGSEASFSVDNFFALTSAQRGQVIGFLRSLGRLEFDHDHDDDIDEDDYRLFMACFGKTGITPDDPCAVSDIDQDGDLDMVDLRALLAAMNIHGK